MLQLLLVLLTFLPFQTIIVQGHKWHVKQVLTIPNCSDCAGETVYETRTIYVTYDQSEKEMQDTIIHEAMHAEFCEVGVNAEAQEENSQTYHEFIYDSAKLFLDLLQSNPKLRNYVVRWPFNPDSVPF